MHLIFAEGRRLDVPAAGDASAKWSMLFPVGVAMHRSDFGRIAFTREMLSTMVANWQAIGKPAKQVNYFHRGASENDGLPVAEKVAAGWIEDLELREDGLYGLIRWTDRARQHIAADELRFLSPEFSLNAVNKLTGKPQGPTLHGAGLLNDPFLEQMPRVAASDTPAEQAKEKHMEKAKLVALLGLTAEASDDDITTAITALSDGQKKHAAAAEAATTSLSEATTDKVTLTEKLTAAESTVTKLTEEKAALAKKLADVEQAQVDAAADAFIKARVDAGVLAPPQTPHARKVFRSDKAAAEALFPITGPKVVQMGEQGVAQGQATDDAATAQKRLDARIAEMQRADGKLTFRDAHAIALSEMPDVKAVLFGAAAQKPTNTNTTRA